MSLFSLSFATISRLQQQLASGLPALEILVRPRNVRQRVDLMNADINSVLLNELEKLLGVVVELFTKSNIVEKSRAEQLRVLSGKASVSA